MITLKNTFLPAFIRQAESQIPHDCENIEMKVDEMKVDEMKVDEMNARMSAIYWKQPKTYLAERCRVKKEISDKMNEVEDVRENEGNNIEACRSHHEETSRLITEVNRGIWQRKVLEAK